MDTHSDISSGFITGNELHFSNAFCDIREFQCSSGGYSLLYTAHKEGRMFILKSLKPEYRNNPVYIALLRKEYEIAYPLDHPSLCKVIAFENTKETGPCIVLEFIDGLPLRDMLRQNRLTTDTGMKIIQELTEAVFYLHRHQIIHRDIKPENIIITHQGCHLKLIDFGLANNDSYRPGPGGVGSKHYTAPEVLEKGEFSPQSDIYSVGILTGEIAQSVKLPNTYKHIARKASNSCIEKRHTSIEQLKKELEKKKHPGKIYFPGISILLILGFAGYFILRPGKQPLQPENKNIQDIYYHCYLSIDSLLKNTKPSGNIDISLPVYEFSKDSMTLSRQLSEIIGKEYGHYRASFEYAKSIRWGEQCLQKWLDNSRKQHACLLKEAIRQHFSQAAENQPWASICRQYIDRFGSIARHNTVFIEQYANEKTDEKNSL